MNCFVLIFVAIAGIALGMYLARRGNEGWTQPLDYARAKKAENKKKILAFVQEHKKIQNNDVEKLTGVSNATAGRYLEELEKEGKLIQHGAIGHGVFYTSE